MLLFHHPGGHGSDIYRELGATNALLYARIENDEENPDFITGNQIARIGIIENPKSFGSDQLLTLDKASAAYGLRLSGTGYSSVTFTADSLISQTNLEQVLLPMEKSLHMIKQQVF